MSEKKPQDCVPTGNQTRCPVCGQVSYSRAGIHPQCSMRQADANSKHRAMLDKQARQANEVATPPVRLSRWQKVCPKCKAVLHARKTACVCGHSFANGNAPPTKESNST